MAAAVSQDHHPYPWEVAGYVNTSGTCVDQPPPPGQAKPTRVHCHLQFTGEGNAPSLPASRPSLSLSLSLSIYLSHYLSIYLSIYLSHYLSLYLSHSLSLSIYPHVSYVLWRSLTGQVPVEVESNDHCSLRGPTAAPSTCTLANRGYSNCKGSQEVLDPLRNPKAAHGGGPTVRQPHKGVRWMASTKQLAIYNGHACKSGKM